MRIFLIPYLILAFNAVGQDSTATPLTQNQIIDTINTLEDGCILMGWLSDEELTPHIERELSIMQLFYELEEVNIKKLLSSKNGKIRFYAFGACCYKYPHIAGNPNLEIYQDSSDFIICTPKGDEKAGISIATIAKDIFQSSKHSNALLNKENEVKEAIQQFIIDYSAYPETYKSINFNEYSFGETVNEDGRVENSENFEIRHVYSIRNKNGEIVELSHYFKLNYALELLIIEEELTGIYNELPREKLNSWIEQYGRELSNAESNALKLPSGD